MATQIVPAVFRNEPQQLSASVPAQHWLGTRAIIDFVDDVMLRVVQRRAAMDAANDLIASGEISARFNCSATPSDPAVEDFTPEASLLVCAWRQAAARSERRKSARISI